MYNDQIDIEYIVYRKNKYKLWIFTKLIPWFFGIKWYYTSKATTSQDQIQIVVVFNAYFCKLKSNAFIGTSYQHSGFGDVCIVLSHGIQQ